MGVSMEGSYFQRLSLCETLSRTVAVYKKGLGVFFPLALLTVGVYSMVWMLMLVVLMPALDLDANRLENDPEYLLAHMATFYALLAISTLMAVVIGAVGNGAYVRAVSDIYLQREPSLSTCIQVGIQNACTMLTASFLGFVGVMLGCLLLYFPGIYLMVRWFLVSPIIIVEGLGAVGALKRSWALVSGSWCYVFCTYSCALAFLLTSQYLWKNLLSVNVYTPAGSLLGSVPSIIYGPILATMMTIMYINLRIEKEGLNAELFDQNLRESNGGNARSGESNYSTLIDKDEFGDLEQPVTSNVV
jgi:hypothetical protein